MTTDPITEKQIAFISRLMDERDLHASPKWFDAVNAMDAEEYAAHVARTKANLSKATRGQASAMIDALLALPVKVEAGVTLDTTVREDLGGATEKQVAFIERLFAERTVDDEVANAYAALKEHKGLTREAASGMIEYLLTMPSAKASAPLTDLPDVPAGRYAIEEAGVVKFYHVDRPTEGRWAGFTFLSAQASDDLHAIRDFKAKRTILERIAKDPGGASRLYGIELGVCGVCGRTLTDEVSRAQGIGPVCAGKMNWTASDREHVAERKERATTTREGRDALAR